MISSNAQKNTSVLMSSNPVLHSLDFFFSLSISSHTMIFIEIIFTIILFFDSFAFYFEFEF
jgi:hypothetical protein